MFVVLGKVMTRFFFDMDNSTMHFILEMIK